PREADFLSLLSAIDLEEAAAPINFTRKPRDENKGTKDDTENEDDDELLPCIANLRCLFIELLPALRDTVLSLLEKAGSETEISSSSVAEIYTNLVDLVVKLKLRFPGWSEFSEEVRLVSLIEEICRWLTIASSSKWDNLTGLLDHVYRAEDISKRLKEEITAGNVDPPVKITRGKRSRADVEGNTSTAELDATTSVAAVTPSIVAACEPFVRQLKLNFDSKLKSLRELASNARSALLKLLEAFQAYSKSREANVSKIGKPIRRRKSMETSIIFASSKVGEAIEIFECAGITCFTESLSNLVKQLEPTGLSECLENCLLESCDEHSNHLAASEELDSLDADTQVAQLIFWWCKQVIRYYSKETEKPEVPEYWLFHLSDMLAIERFLFGGIDAKNEEEQDSDRLGSEGNSCPAQIAKCRSDLTTYALKLREFRQQVGRLIKIDENTLPSTILEKLIEATVRCPVPVKLLRELWELISRGEFDKFTVSRK
ncbi:hypothetical protein ACTXT7_015787, partial [Hymenolepis weldensis]